MVGDVVVVNVDVFVVFVVNTVVVDDFSLPHSSPSPIQFTPYPKPPKHPSSPYEQYMTILTDVNMVLTVLFFIEAVLKIFAFGAKVGVWGVEGGCLGG